MINRKYKMCDTSSVSIYTNPLSCKNLTGGGESVDNQIVVEQSLKDENQIVHNPYSWLLNFACAELCNSRSSSFIFPLLIVFCLFFSVNAWAWSGEGTESSPYLIENKSDLQTLATNVNDGNDYSGNYFLVTSPIGSSNDKVTFCIGSSSKIFSGTFDGGKKEIWVGISGSSQLALFPYVRNATIKNVVINGSVTGTGTFVGGIVCKAQNSTISGCVNNAAVDGTVNIGGVVCSCDRIPGNLETFTTVENCINNGNIGCNNNSSKRGGITATCYASKIIGCTNNGTVKGETALGGIAFAADNGSVIDKCVNTGLISGSGKPDFYYIFWGIGGIVGGCADGTNNFSTELTIINSYNTGTIEYTGSDIESEYYCLGGILGNSKYNNAEDVNIKNCYNIGQVKTNHNRGMGIGGIIGYSANATIQNCYNGYKVSNTCSNYANVGAISGYTTPNTRISNCYGWEESAVTTCSNQSYNMQLAGTNYYSPTTTQSAWFKHNSNTDNKLISNVSVNEIGYTASNTNSLLTVLKAWVTANGSDYLTWDDASSNSDNKGMPKFKTCTPITATITNVTSGYQQNEISWTVSPQNATCTYSVSWTSSAGNGNRSATSPFNHTGLTNDVSYCYRVVAVGTGDYCDVNELSAQVCGTPQCTSLGRPSITSIDVGDRQVTVNWNMNGVDNANSYTLYYGVNDPNVSTTNVYKKENATSPCSVPRLTNRQLYKFALMPVGSIPNCSTNQLSQTESATPNCQ